MSVPDWTDMNAPVNAIECQKCNYVIRSFSRHDFKSCSCGAVFVDGGEDYQRIGGHKDDWERILTLSQWVEALEERDVYVGTKWTQWRLDE